MKKIVSFATLLLFACIAQAQEKSGFLVADSFGVTPVLRDLPAEEAQEKPKNRKHEMEDRENRKPQHFEFSAEDDSRYGNDPKSIQRTMGSIPGGQLKLNIAGQSGGGARPFDPSGAVGIDHYVQVINATTFKVYDKNTGASLYTHSLGTLWSPSTGNDGDPIVMYDKAADRWFIAQFGVSGNKIYIAISATGDPSGSYYTYTFTSPQFPDYLKFSVWQDGYYMTSNLNTQRVFAFERSAMLNGVPGARMVYTSFNPPTGNGFFCPLTGCTSDGDLPPAGTPCPIFSYSDNGWGGSNQDRVNIYKMTVNWTPTTPTATITAANNVSTASFDGSYNSSWNDVSQPNTTQKLDGIGGVCMFRAQYKMWEGYNSVVLNWAVKISATQRSIKWCELRQDQTTGSWSMYQEGIYTPDAATRWMGAILMDDNGSIGLSYMKSDATGIYPGLYFTGRRACDPLGTLPITETLVAAGTGSQTGVNRDGDYAHSTLDPVDGVTIWSTSEYMGGATGGSAAKTRIFSYQIASCNASVNIAISNGANPACAGTPVTFTASGTNGGVTPSYEWQLNGSTVGDNSATYTLNNPQQGDVITCTMTSSDPEIISGTALSNTIMLDVLSGLIASVDITPTDGSVCQGIPTTFTATPTNGGSGVQYQWLVDGVDMGSNSNTYAATFQEGQSVVCNMTSSLTCTTNPNASASYSVTLTPTSSPSASIALTVGQNPSAVGEPITFTATAENAGSNPGYQWYINGNAVSGATNATYSSSNLSNGQIISCVVTSSSPCSTSPQATTNEITMTIDPSIYCGGGAENESQEYISNVTVGTISNTTGPSTYSSYTTLSTDILVGTPLPITVALGNSFSTDHIMIWVDWNHNGSFSDGGEQEYFSSNGTGPFNATISAPAAALPGPTRMRIRLSDSSQGNVSSPCGFSAYGEVEDYTLQVLSGANAIEEPGVEASGENAPLFTLFPNPSNDQTTIQSDHAGIFYLINSSGQLVKQIDLNSSNKFTFQLTDLAAGYYIVSGQTGRGVARQKLVVVK